MSIVKHRKKSVTAALGVAVAAVAAPAMLFLGTGTAQAGGWVNKHADYLGVTVYVHSDGGTWGNCLYDAIPTSGVGIPVFDRPFHLDPGGLTELWFPGIRLNTTWQTNVTCDVGPAFSDIVTY